MITSPTAKYAWLTVAVAFVTLLAKSVGAYVTGSVGLFSDALESIINLASSVMLVVTLRIAKAPPDDEHPYGHDKAEYFANGVQGTLILVAAIGILSASIGRFLEPQQLESGVLGLGLVAGASILNLVTAQFLKARAKTLRSHALSGEADHLMSDVWTSAAVILGVGLVYVTGKPWLDPLAAMVVTLLILFTGLRLIRNSVTGLMDAALPLDLHQLVVEILESYKQNQGLDYHALRSRVSGARTFLSVHILVPGAWSVKKGHELAEEVERAISKVVPGATVLTHIEPIEEDCSFEDLEIA